MLRLPVALGIACVIAGGVIVSSAITTPQSTEAAAPTTVSQTDEQALLRASGTSADTVQEEPASPASTGRMVIPEIGLDAPLGSMPHAADLEPPTFDSAYQVVGGGFDDARGDSTMLVAIHSSWAGDNPGDRLNDIGTGTPAQISTIYLDGVQFKVTSTRNVSKDSIADEAGLWTGEHDLVLVTCQQTATTPLTGSVDNAVFTAERVN